MNECWRCEGVVALSTLSWIHTLLCDGIQNLKQKMLPSPHSLHYWAFFQHDNEDIHSPKVKILQWTSISLSLNALEQLWGISVETSWAKLAIKDQSIQGGRPPGVKQDRCENLSWTCTLSAKKGQSSILKVLEDILSTRILYICWIKSRVYSFLQSFI